MAHRTATLYIRITTADGKRRYCKAAYQTKGRLKPPYAMVCGEPEHHKEGVYYVRFGADGGKQQFVLVGRDPFVALDKLEEKKRWLRDRERQVVPPTPHTGGGNSEKNCFRARIFLNAISGSSGFLGFALGFEDDGDIDMKQFWQMKQRVLDQMLGDK
jgi:hypothetical protein